MTEPAGFGERVLTAMLKGVVHWILLPAWIARGIVRVFPSLREPTRRAALLDVPLLLCVGWLGATIAVGAALISSWTGWTKWSAAVLCFVLVNLILHSAISKSVEELLGPSTPPQKRPPA